MTAVTVTTHIGRQWREEAALGLRTINTRELAFLQSSAITGGTDITEIWDVGNSYSEISSDGGYARFDLAGDYTVLGAPSSFPTWAIAEHSITANTVSLNDFDLIAEIWTDSLGNECITQVWTTTQVFSVSPGSTFKTGVLQYDMVNQ